MRKFSLVRPETLTPFVVLTAASSMTRSTSVDILNSLLGFWAKPEDGRSRKISHVVRFVFPRPPGCKPRLDGRSVWEGQMPIIGLPGLRALQEAGHTARND